MANLWAAHILLEFYSTFSNWYISEGGKEHNSWVSKLREAYPFRCFAMQSNVIGMSPTIIAPP